MLSMTGYGRGHSFQNGHDFTVDIKTVNHRFLDLNFRLPRELSFLEQPFRERLTNGSLMRGHAEITLTYQNSAGSTDYVVDEQRFSRFCDLVGKLHKNYRQLKKMSVLEALNASEALSIVTLEADPALLTELALKALDEAVSSLVLMRETEGKHLMLNLFSYLDELEEIRQKIALRAPQIPQLYRQRLTERLKEWNVEDSIDPQRLAQEVALMADKCAIDEEISRLEGHIRHFSEIAPTEGETGKKLDFLIQEMNREMNTIGSKANDDEIIGNVLSGKCVIEKLREQIQNAV